MHSGRGRGELPELARVVKGALLRTAWQKASQVTSTKLTEHRVQLGREGVRIRIRPVCGHNP